MNLKKAVRRTMVIILTLAITFSSFSNGGWIERANGAEPEVWVEISDQAGLVAINGNLSANYRLMSDIVLTGNWTPLGTFTGKLDGNGKVIRNLTISNTTLTNAGLFSVIGVGGQIYNLGIEGANITAGNNTGILAGTNYGAITRAYTKGIVSGQENVGGLVGTNTSPAAIDNCFATASVSGKDMLGGLVGANSGSINQSYSTSQLESSVFNNYVEFNGTPVGNYSAPNTGGYIDIVHKDVYVQNQFTLEAWFQWDDVGTSDCNFIIGKGYEQFEIHTGGGSGVNGLRFIPIWNNGGDSWIDVKNVIQPGWFHVAAVYDYNDSLKQATARVFINGVAQNLWRGATDLGKTATIDRETNTLGYGKVNVADTVLVKQENNINIGRRTDKWFYFDGKICDVRFWNIARTEEEIKRDKDKVLTGTETGLVGYWKLNEASGNAIDSTGNQNNGELKENIARTSEVASTNKGGLVGSNTGTVTNSYYDSTVSLQSDTGKGDAKTAEQMKDQETFAGWDFANTWGSDVAVNNGYPYLKQAYTVTFKDYDGNILKSQTVLSGGEATAPTVPERTGYTFTGWSPAAFTNITGNLTVTAQYTDNSAKAITAFSLNGVAGTVNEVAKTITLTLPSANLTALAPTIVHTGTSVSPASLAIQDFTNPVTYTVTAVDNSTCEYTVTAKTEFAGGDGSEANPYQITKLEHLSNIRLHLDNKNFKLMNDLDFSDNGSYNDLNNKASWTTGLGWQPIASNSNPFYGTLDGNNHIIKGLYINRTSEQNVGLFSGNAGLIKTLGLADVNINGLGIVGAFVGWNSYSTSSATIKGEVDKCFASGNVQGDYCIGGLVGRNDGIISNSYVTANIKATNRDVGGIAGGSNGDNGINMAKFTNCFVSGKVYGTSTGIDGIVGYKVNGSTVTNCYYNTNTTSLTGGFGTGITTLQIKQKANFTDFDFTNTWNIQDGITFPYLRWQATHQDQAWPAFEEGFTSITNVGFDSMDLHLKTDETGKVYYVVLPAANTAPSESEIKNGTGSGGSVAVTHSSIDVTANSEVIKVINNLPPNKAYKIHMVTEDGLGNLQLVPESLTVNLVASAPIINTQPTSKVPNVGQTVDFTIAATAGDGETLSYQWQKSTDEGDNWNDIVGAVSTSYTTGALAISDNGSQYRCIVTISRNSTTATSTIATSLTLTTAAAISSAADLTINPATVPTINTQPISITKVVGMTANFTAGATVGDGGTISYLWQKSTDEGTTWNNIDGASSTQYNTGVLALSDNGSKYRCVVTNSKNSTTATAISNVATLSVGLAPATPTITTQPVSIANDIGQTATFTVVATVGDGGILSWQWQKSIDEGVNWSNLDGATSTSCTTSALVLSDTGSRYRCIITNSNSFSTSSISSNEAILTVNRAAAPIINAQPTSITKVIGQTATFTVGAVVGDGGTLSWQWQKSTDEGVTWNNIDGATSTSCTTSALALSNTGSRYRCIITNSNNSATATLTSDAVTLTVTPPAPVENSGGNTTPTPTTKPVPVIVIVNGVEQEAASSETKKVNDKTVTTITLDDKKIEDKLEKEGQGATVVIPVSNRADIVVGELNGQTIKNMETKEAILEIKTENVTYTLPASQINIDDVSSQIGQQIKLKDIKVSVTVAAPEQDTVKIIEDTANKNNYQLVVKPIEFNITCTSGGKTVEVSKFNGYVERTVAIPEGIDPSKITTGIVLNSDGTFSHVPTTIIVISGKYYAKINSLTNSSYSVIWNKVKFGDVATHWAEDAVNDMGSRLIMNGVKGENFEPNSEITRAEFAAIVVTALGIMRPGTGKDTFDDVQKDAWYYDAVSIANEYGIITGYGNRKFGPMDKINREQAMTIIARAMTVTKLKSEFVKGESEKLLIPYVDSEKASDWARNAIAACIKAGIVSGRSRKRLAPEENITRAEVAVIVRKLLLESKLI